MNKNFYKEIFENIPDGIIVSDVDFKIINVNFAVETLTNYSSNDLAQKKLNELIHLEKGGCPYCLCNSASYYLPEQFAHQANIINKNGESIPVKIHHKKIDDEKTISIISPLSESNFLDQAHVDFVSTVSHELRTPLTSIKGFADTLLSAGDKLAPEQQRKFISIIKTQIDRLTRLVEDLLTVSRLESKKDKYIYKSIDFSRFIEQLLQILQPKIQNHKIKTNIGANLPQILADSDKLEQIMTNLIDNAVKYSNPNTKITIDAGFANNAPDFVQIRVKDEGVGIPKEFLPKIFTKFSRIDNPLTRQVQGTGLGLYITKSLVEGMNGKILAESNKNGSIFTITLPVSTYEKQAAHFTKN